MATPGLHYEPDFLLTNLRRKYRRQIHRKLWKTRNYYRLIWQHNSLQLITITPVLFLISFAVHFQLIINQIKYPIIRNASLSIERQLGCAIVLQSRIGNLNYQ